jgi:hypothetical protein
VAPLAGMSGGDIEVLRCADYTLRTCRSSKGAELDGFRGDGAGGADEERVVALLGKPGGFGFFVGEIGWRGGHFSAEIFTGVTTSVCSSTMHLDVFL